MEIVKKQKSVLVDFETYNLDHVRKNTKIIESVAGKMLQISYNKNCTNNNN